MARMLGKTRPSWCPTCRATPGLDCPDAGHDKRQVRRDEDRAWRAEAVQDIADDAIAHPEWLLRPLDRPFPPGYWDTVPDR